MAGIEPLIAEEWKARAEAAEAREREKDARVAELTRDLEQAIARNLEWQPSPTHELERAVVEAAMAWSRCEAREDVIKAACDALAEKLVGKDA